ncbi:uncharacterized protein TNCV_3167331 [Trichonephila clavipes]|uniref:Uncharacterized protein n=1 Tax=Trichonephila clavipes TaxID=2585209 RepID=A0A8X6V0N1_TRICX|nr:uncharacterized protein TNCV_3167331 [Trichonephila clavipes]
MPPNTLRVHKEYALVKSVGPKVLWAESRVQGTGVYFSPLQSHGKIVEMETGGVAIYRLFKEFHRANSYCHLYGAQGLGQRQAYFSCNDEFRGPRSDYAKQVDKIRRTGVLVRQMALATTQQQQVLRIFPCI